MKLSEVVIEAKYADIILTLLSKPYQITSVSKMLFFSFCIQHEDENNFSSYSHRTKDFADIFFKNIYLNLMKDYQDLTSILIVLDMLVKSKKIQTEKDNIKIVAEITHNPENKFLQNCIKKVPNPIIEVNKLDPTAVIEEVIRYV